MKRAQSTYGLAVGILIVDVAGEWRLSQRHECMAEQCHKDLCHHLCSHLLPSSTTTQLFLKPCSIKMSPGIHFKLSPQLFPFFSFLDAFCCSLKVVAIVLVSFSALMFLMFIYFYINNTCFHLFICWSLILHGVW